MARNVGTQGHGDGFCGIYSMAHSLTDWPKLQSFEIPLREAFRRLVLAADRLDLFDVYHAIDGFEDFELAQIFNQMATSYRLSRIAIPLELVSQRVGRVSNITVVREVISSGGSVVVSVENGGHWVLANKNLPDGSVAVIDSWPNSNRETLAKISTVEDGVALLPRNSDLAKLS